MNCDEFENRILASVADHWSSDERAAGEKHLAGCASCRTLSRQLQQLDAALSRTVKSPVLPATFQARLRQRIQTQSVVLPVEQRAKRKLQLQAEYEAGLARLAWRMPVSPSLLKYFGYAAAIVLASLVIHWLVNSASGAGLKGIRSNMLLGLASATFLAVGMAAAFPRSVRKIWSAV